MNNRFTITQLQNTPAARNPANKALFSNEVIKEPIGKEKEAGSEGNKAIQAFSKEKAWISQSLQLWCMSKRLSLTTEFKFLTERKYRSDWYIKEINCLIEYEGLFSDKSGHTTPAGYTKDADKYNLASLAGYKLIRLTPKNYKNLFTYLNKIEV